MSRRARQLRALEGSLMVAITGALVLFGVGLLMAAMWLCILASIAMWAIVLVMYAALAHFYE